MKAPAVTAGPRRPPGHRAFPVPGVRKADERCIAPGPWIVIRRMPASIASRRSAVSGLSTPSGTIPARGNVAFIIRISARSGSVCDLVDRLVEHIDLAVGIGEDLRGALGREHLGSGIKRHCSDHTRDSHTVGVTGHDMVAVEDTGTATAVDRVAEEREPDSGTHDTTVVGARETGLVLKQVVEVPAAA